MIGALAEQGVAQDLSWCVNFAEEMIPTRREAARLSIVWKAIQANLYMEAYTQALLRECL